MGDEHGSQMGDEHGSQMGDEHGSQNAGLSPRYFPVPELHTGGVYYPQHEQHRISQDCLAGHAICAENDAKESRLCSDCSTYPESRHWWQHSHVYDHPLGAAEAARIPDRLVQISGGSTIGRYEEIKAAARSYSELGVFMIGVGNPTLLGASGPEVLRAARVSGNFLRILGVEPMLGRSFQPEEDAPGGPPVAMISAELWQRRFGSDPLIVGKTAPLAGTPHTI